MRLARSKFKKWLLAQGSGLVVGKARDCHSCPLAYFHREVGGNDAVISDNGGAYTIDRGDGDRRLPFWAEKFAMLVDHEGGVITRERALELLSEC